jgi:hypothetical protein
VAGDPLADSEASAPPPVAASGRSKTVSLPAGGGARCSESATMPGFGVWIAATDLPGRMVSYPIGICVSKAGRRRARADGDTSHCHSLRESESTGPAAIALFLALLRESGDRIWRSYVHGGPNQSLNAP